MRITAAVKGYPMQGPALGGVAGHGPARCFPFHGSGGVVGTRLGGNRPADWWYSQSTPQKGQKGFDSLRNFVRIEDAANHKP